jgi:four helix bundle protein
MEHFMKTFRTYHLARNFYRLIVPLKLVRPLRDQLRRAAASVALNLAEGYGRQSLPDQQRFFAIALGSIRECQAVFDLACETIPPDLHDLLDRLAASTWRLLHPAR